MTDEEPQTLILGVQFCDTPLGDRIPLYWDKEKGKKGYHSITWEKTSGGFSIKSRSYMRGTGHEEQAGVILSELFEKSPHYWYWAKEPVPLFPGAHGFYMKKDLTDTLRELSEEDAFSGLEVRDELHGRDVIVGFGTVETIQSRRSKWYEQLQSSADNLMRQYLLEGSNEAETRKVTRWLNYLHTTEGQSEQSRLRYLIVHHPDISDTKLELACSFMGSTYEMYDREAGTGLVKRTEDQRRVIVPDNKILAKPENLRKALDELRSTLMQL